MDNSNPNILRHLQIVTDYLWEAEAKDFVDRPPEEAGPHLFNSLVILNQWLRELFSAAQD